MALAEKLRLAVSRLIVAGNGTRAEQSAAARRPPANAKDPDDLLPRMSRPIPQLRDVPSSARV